MFAIKSTFPILTRAAATLALLALASAAQAQTPEHVAEVKAAFEKAPVRAGTCAPATEALQGWPADVLLRCEYKRGDLAGVAYVLDVKPETMANWIETSCKTQMVGIDSCFERMTKCLGEKSGASFIVGGNGVSERQGAAQNVFYRNGVAISAKPGAASIEEQEQLARMPEANIATMLGGGGVSYWHTLPYQFAVKALELGVPAEMNTPDRRQRWLEAIRTEMLATLTKPENRFLTGWMIAHPITLRTGECADDRDP
jgi:hypothetical protein